MQSFTWLSRFSCCLLDFPWRGPSPDAYNIFIIELDNKTDPRSNVLCNCWNLQVRFLNNQEYSFFTGHNAVLKESILTNFALDNVWLQRTYINMYIQSCNWSILASLFLWSRFIYFVQCLDSPLYLVIFSCSTLTFK